MSNYWKLFTLDDVLVVVLPLSLVKVVKSFERVRWNIGKGSRVKSVTDIDQTRDQDIVTVKFLEYIYLKTSYIGKHWSNSESYF